MCGISGWTLAQAGKFGTPDLETMQKSVAHRGPDDSGIFEAAECGIALAHNRLSIIDLSNHGHQPMVNAANGDVLIFNGEIYNFRDLRKQLEKRNYRFHSESDTEVLLYAFAEWGIDCVQKIKGMFAFAIWSPQNDALYLARDSMGIKPLLCWNMEDGAGIVFASEIKAFLGLPGFRRTINRKSLAQFLEFGFSCEENTVFAGVQKLTPGTWQKISRGRIVENQTYFTPATPSLISDIEVPALVEHIYQTLDTVVAEQLVADVPVGILLSGGLDSSLIAALACRHKPVETFTMGFGQSEIDERPFARTVSRFIGSDHHELEITPEEITHDLESNVAHFDDLFADWGMISTRLLYQKCRDQGIKVVIVGEGADELFGGYGVFRNALPGALKGPKAWRLFQLYRQYAGRRYGSQYRVFSRLMRGYLNESNNDYFHAIRMFESRHQLPNNYVMKVDRASMAVSVEARVPYLDSRVAEIAYTVPRELLINETGEKLLLRKVASQYNLLPDEIIQRQKFGAPLASSWMNESPKFRAYAREIILGKQSWVDELGLRTAMTAYFDKGKTGYAFPHSISIFRNLAWRLLLLNLWSRTYLERSNAH